MKTVQLNRYHWQIVKDEAEPFSHHADVLGEALVPYGYVSNRDTDRWYVWSRAGRHSDGKWVKGDQLDALAKLMEMIGDEPDNTRRGTRSRRRGEVDGRDAPGVRMGADDAGPGDDDREAGVSA